MINFTVWMGNLSRIDPLDFWHHANCKPLPFRAKWQPFFEEPLLEHPRRSSMNTIFASSMT